MKIKEVFLKSGELDGKSVSICGWVRTLRASKMFGFVEVNDGSFFKNIQVVIEEEKLENFAKLCKLNVIKINLTACVCSVKTESEVCN